MSFRVLIAEAFKKYRDEYIVMHGQSPKTEEAYSNTGKLLVKFFGNMDITKLDFDSVRNWRTHLASYQRPDTVRNNIVNLRNVLKYLRRELIPVIDYDRIPVQKKQKRTIKYLTEDEFERFIIEAGKPIRGYSHLNQLRNVALIETLYATGLRNNELCAMNRNTIRDRQFTIVGKSKNPRIGFIDERALKAVENYLEARTDNNAALFISPQTGDRIRAQERSGVYFRTYATDRRSSKKYIPILSGIVTPPNC